MCSSASPTGSMSPAPCSTSARGRGRPAEHRSRGAAPAEADSEIAELIPTDFLWTPDRAGDEYLADVRQCIDSLVSFDNRFGGAEVSRLSEEVFDAVRRRLGSLDYEPSIKSDLAAAVGMHAGFMNQPGEALDIAELVLDGDDYRLTPRLRALSLTRRARALAQVGADASAGLFDEIRSLFLDGVDDADPPLAWWIDERELLWHEAMCRKDLGDNRTALDCFESSGEAATTGDRRSDFIHRAYLLGGKVAARSWRSAESTMTELEQMATDVASPRSVLVIRDALADLRRPSLCAPRHLVDHTASFDASLAGTVSPRGD